MNEVTCNGRSGELAIYALGQLDEAEYAELKIHLAACEKCRAMSAELTTTVGALDKLQTSAPSVPAVVISSDLAEEVLAGIGADDADVVRGARFRYVAIACASVAAILIVAVAVAAGVSHGGPPTKTLALHGTLGATASATLMEKPWGTALTIHEQGLVSGRTYTVSMDDPHGRWWTAGSYRTAGPGPVEVTMACAARYASVYEIRVTDSTGKAVLSSEPN